MHVEHRAERITVLRGEAAGGEGHALEQERLDAAEQPAARRLLPVRMEHHRIVEQHEHFAGVAAANVEAGTFVDLRDARERLQRAHQIGRRARRADDVERPHGVRGGGQCGAPRRRHRDAVADRRGDQLDLKRLERERIERHRDGGEAVAENHQRTGARIGERQLEVAGAVGLGADLCPVDIDQDAWHRQTALIADEAAKHQIGRHRTARERREQQREQHHVHFDGTPAPRASVNRRTSPAVAERHRRSCLDGRRDPEIALAGRTRAATPKFFVLWDAEPFSPPLRGRSVCRSTERRRRSIPTIAIAGFQMTNIRTSARIGQFVGAIAP